MYAQHSRFIALCAMVLTIVLPAKVSAASLLLEQPLEQQHQEFAKNVWEKHNIPIEQTLALINKANKNQAILDAISRPWEAKPWFQYHPIFLTDARLKKGLAFWETHKDALAKAEKTYGVPAQIIVSIIGIETNYGSYFGNYSVLDALYTLGFHYPPRSAFFLSELEQYLLLTKEENFDPLALKGSYAGAMGYGQFISSSYRHYAVDFDGDGKRDLLTNPVDAIGSVANYFRQHKWQTGEPVAARAKVDTTQLNTLLSDDLTYTHNWQQLRNSDVNLLAPSEITPDTQAKLFQFETELGYEYWVGWPNFYVITRYNHSPLYAMVIYQFSEQLKQGRETL